MSKKIILYFLYYLSIAFLTLVLYDLFFGTYLQGKQTNVDRGCYEEITHHNYCPNIILERKMHKLDGGEVITNYVNYRGIRVEKESDMDKAMNLSSFDVINIGDSFMQAEELEYHDTLSHILANKTNLKVIQIGYASWAPYNILNYLKQEKIKEGAIVNIFTMINDFPKNYYYSNHNYKNFPQDIIDNTVYFKKWKDNNPSIYNIKKYIQFHSKLYKMYSHFIGRFKNTSQKLQNARNLEKFEFNDNFINLKKDCSKLYSLKERVSPLLFNYLEFAFDKECWEIDTFESVNNSVSDINKIIKYIEASGGKAVIYLIPAGWNFENENLAGKALPPYNIGERGLIGLRGLSLYLNEMIDSELINLEEIIENEKKISPNNSLYFSYDGHFNRSAHKLLAKFIINKEKI